MTTKFSNNSFISLVSYKNLNHGALRAMLVMLCFVLGIGNAWGSATYKLQLKTVTQNNTGYGKVYATEANVAPEYSSYYTSKEPAYGAEEISSKEYYLWAVPTQRGVVFNNWTTSSTSTGSCTAGSSTLTDANKMQGAKVTVKAPTNADGTDTYTTTATVTANWKNQNSKVAVTYATPVDGKYRVTYEYSYLNTSTNALETGFTFDMDGSSAARSEDSYNNDVITLQSLDGVFDGWYDGSTLLSTENPYTYVAPASGGSVTISAHYTHVDKYYGRLTASVAEVPYSMPGGGTIFIANDPDVSGTYSADAQSVSNETYGESQNYYLHAQPNDKRYVFRGWYSDAACTSLISTNADYAYTFTSSSTNSASPTLGNVYAAFDFNLYYMQVEVEPAVPGLGMVLVKDNNTGTPEYTDYTTHTEQFLYAYRLAPTANAYLYAKPKYGYKFSGWYDNPDCTGTAKSTANPYTYAATGTSTDPMNPTIIKLYAKFVEDATIVNITYNLPDQTKGEYTASVLDIAEVDDDFIWTFTQVFTSEGKTGNTTQAQHKTDVLRLEAQPKAGYGVTSWTIAGAAKTTPSQLYETTGTAAATYGVAFGDAKPFLVSTNSTQYATLREALTAVGNSGKITVVQNAYVEAGNYTIPSGVTLLVPYESTGKSYTSPSTNYEKIQEFSSATQYVLLTLSSGVNISLSGNLIVMADLCAPVGGGAGSGAPLSAYGRIAMLENSTITVNSGANLYCWGYITGIEGLVTAKSGATIHEIFQHQNNPGGTAASGWNEDAFFLNQYYVQNIESPLKIEYGASETVYAQMTVPSSTINNLSASLIGKDDVGMFALTSSGSYLIRTYDPSTDRITYDIYGNVKLNYISMSVYGMDLNTSKYVLPITSNMSVKCHTLNGNASTFNIQYAVSFIPGAELFADEGVTLNIQNKLIIYDRDEWIGKNFAQFNKYSGGYNWTRSSFTPTRTYIRVNADLVDAKVDLNGTMNVSGSLYTTNSGATIISSNGTGVVKLSSAAPGNSNDIQYSANKLGASIKVPMTPAQLHNGDDSYTLTAGAVANDQFIYSKSQEKWLKNPKVVSWNANGGTTEASTMAYSQGSFVGELPAAYKDGHTLEGWYTAADGGTQITPSTKVTANVTYYAHWTPKSYSITYRDQGGAAFSGTHVDSPNAHPTTHTFGTATTLNGVNNKTGYTFGGWYRTPSCSGTVVTSIAASECKNITLYAKWIPNTHKLTWDWNGGATSSTTYTAAGDAVAYNTTIVYPADNTLTKANFVFNGWDKSITTMPDEDLTITAQWEPAVASVTAGSTTTYYTTFVDALTYAKTQATATITILDDITETSTALTYNKASGNCTLNLNGKMVTLTITGAGTSEIKMFNINAASSTFTITDNSTDKDGILKLIASPTTTTQTKRWHGVYLTDGTLMLKAGKVYAEDNFKYTSTSDAGMVSGVTIAAGKTFTMTGGSIDAYCKYAAYGLQVNGSASANANINISGGTIHAETTEKTTAYGIYTLGGTTTISGGTIEAKSKTTTAAGIYVQSSKSGYAGKVEMTGGTVNSTSTTTTAYGILVQVNATGKIPAEFTMSGGTVNVTTGTHTAFGVYVNRAPADAENIYRAIANISGGEINVTSTTTSSTSGKEVTDGIYSLGTTTITGNPEIIVTATKTYARGIRVLDGKTTISGTPTFTVRATQYAYGAVVAGVAPTAAGVCSNAELEINNGTFDVATTGTTYAYGAFVQPVAPVATEDPEVFYKSPSTLTINDGHFTVKAQTTTAQGVNCSRGTLMAGTLPNTLLAENLGTAHINGGTFDVSTLGTTTAHGITNSGNTTVGNATFNVTPKSTTAYGARCYHGLLTINEGSEFNVTATATAYGVVAGNEQPTTGGVLYDAEVVINGGTIDVKTTSKATIYGLWASRNSRTIATGTANEGNYASAGKITVNGGEIKVAAKTNPAYAVMVDDVVTQSGNADYPAATATPQAFINGGKFYVTATSSKNYAVSATPLAENCQITGGYYNTHTTQTSGTYLDKYVVSPNKKLTLRESHTLYPDGYRYTVNEGGTVTWKNGTTTLKTEMYESGETPAYSGATPTKAEDAEYTYTHNGWNPTVEAMANADQTYTATFNHIEKKYTVNVSAGEHGSVSPASVSGIGCVTASGDITATPNTGYRLDNWTLPTGVTAADGYTSESNPIHIHATASDKTITANFAAKTYTVTLDNQSATTAGAASVTATYNEAMPSIAANLPAKTGYAFGGYFSETNGGGTQYYNADGTSAHIWDVDAVSPTLYAQWTSSVVETGPVLDIVDATNDGANGTLTLNATSWPNSAAGYYINEVLYTRSGNRTIVINYTGKEPGESFEINVKKSGAAESYSCHSYTIPRVITSNTAITEDQNWPIFVKGATLTVDNDIATGKIYVGADAKLVINETNTLTAEGIYLRTTPTAAAEMLNNGSIDAQLYYTRIIDSKANYYPFGLPLDCDIEDVTMSDGSARPKYGSGWLLRWYDESSRAANGGTTNNMTSKEGDPAEFPTKIVGGRGYEMFSASNYYREFYFPIDHSKLKSTVPVSYTENGAAGEKHAGWNVLVSPWTWAHNQISKPENITICWLEGNTWGEQDNPDVIPPSKLFAYQASPGQSIVSLAGTNIAAARRRVAAAEEPTRIQWIRLDVKDVNSEGDQTSIYSHPTRYEQTYKTGIDVAKQALTSTHAILYSSHAYGDMAFAGVADAQLEQGVPLTVYSPSAQELTISMRDNDWLNRMESVWLIDKEEGMRIDLLNGYYTFNASEGTTRGRFFIQGQFKAPQIATDIQNGQSGEVQTTKARKLMINQKIFIEINGRLYDATGKEVKR